MATIYVYGCETCGVQGAQVKAAQKKQFDIRVRNSKYDKIARDEHAYYLRTAGLPTDSYMSIVVDGGVVMRVEQWIGCL